MPDHRRSLHNPGHIQLRGRLAGLTDSWFSLLLNGNELSGIINDGNDIYLIEPYRHVAELLIEPPADSKPANLIFRLADMLIPQGLIACATHDEASPTGKYIDGQSAAVKLGAELQTASGIETASVRLPLLVGVVADESFYDLHTTDTESDIAAIFNTVDGILFNEIGLELEVDNVLSVAPDVFNPFSGTHHYRRTTR